MDKEKELPKRKPTRLKNFDYSSAGAYFVTICIRDRMHILSEIVKENLTATDKTNGISVGEGLAPPEITGDKGVKYMKKAIWIIISIILAIIIVMDVFLFICGSLEAFVLMRVIKNK